MTAARFTVPGGSTPSYRLDGAVKSDTYSECHRAMSDGGFSIAWMILEEHGIDSVVVVDYPVWIRFCP